MFDIYEEKLRQLVKSAQTPVLGLLGGLLSSEAKDAVSRDLSFTPSVRAYSQRLEKYPALFAVWLAEHVMLGLGQDGQFSLYPHLQKAMGITAELTQDERELIWRAFRRALFKLGIQPLPRITGHHFMFNEYVRQAGVPIAFADDLAAQMLGLARRLGLPDEDDQDGLLTWQAALLNKLAAPFSITVKKAVERDSIGYYTRAFVRVHLNGGQATVDDDPLELAFAKAFACEKLPHIKRAAIPELLYRDGALGILFLPSETSTAYRVVCDGYSAAVRVDALGLFRALPSGLHREVAVQREDGERVLSVKLWPDTLSNRLLIFNAAGRLRASAQLSQVDPVELVPGRYVALCRFEPSNLDDWDEVSGSPRLVEVPLEVRPGAELVLMNGPAAVAVHGENQPSFSLDGTIKASLEGAEFWYGALLAEVEIPVEWLCSDTCSFEVRVFCGDQHDQKISIPVVLDGVGKATVNISGALAKLAVLGGLRRIVLELARVGEARTLHRQSVWYWVGLSAVSYGLRFACEQSPQNLVVSSCVGVKVEPHQIEPLEEQSRILRIIFDVGRGRLVHLSWHRPGIFVEVQVSARDGSALVLPRRLGAEETVSLTSTKTVVVSASEPGYITLGDMRTFVDFSQRASKVFPASFLASRIEPGARTLAYETQSGNASTPLLLLSHPHVATEIKVERLDNLFEIKITVRGEPTHMAVAGSELASGREVKGEHELMAGTWHTNDVGRMQMYATPAGDSYDLYLLLDIESFRSGVWILNFFVRIGAVWGRLQCAEEGRVAIALAVKAGQELSDKEVIAEVEALEVPGAIARLSRLNEHFRQYWSSVSWEQQKWLTPYFTALVNRLQDHEEGYVTELVDMAMCRASDDVRPGFLSMQWAPALLNRTFSQPRAIYKTVNIKAHPLSIALRAMPELRGSIAPAFGVVLHPVAAMSFKNVAEVMHGRRPKEFRMLDYRGALQQTMPEAVYQLDDELFLPQEGELLGPLHLAHAWRDLERGFLNSQLMPNNRKSAALAVAKRLEMHHGFFDSSAPVGLRKQLLLLQVAQRSNSDAHIDCPLDEEALLRQEHMEHVVNACAWLAWYCRLEQRQEGALKKFHALLSVLRKQVEVPVATVSDCIAYYMQVAPAIFAFYLLLWELVLTVELDPVVQNV